MTHANRGKGWEAQLLAWHDQYRRDRLAVVWKTEPGVKAVRGRVIYDAKGPPDFVGVLADTGQFVIFDAKTTDKPRWALSSLAPHQARDLEAAHIAGARAFVALRLAGVPYVLPWAALGPLYWRHAEGLAKRGEASVDGSIGIPMGERGWLSAW